MLNFMTHSPTGPGFFDSRNFMLRRPNSGATFRARCKIFKTSGGKMQLGCPPSLRNSVFAGQKKHPLLWNDRVFPSFSTSTSDTMPKPRCKNSFMALASVSASVTVSTGNNSASSFPSWGKNFLPSSALSDF